MFENKLGLRVLILIGFMLIAALIMLPSGTIDKYGILVAFWFGHLIPALCIGIIVGWLAYSRRAWLITTASLLGLTLVVLISAKYSDAFSRMAIAILATLVMGILWAMNEAWGKIRKLRSKNSPDQDLDKAEINFSENQ